MAKTTQRIGFSLVAVSTDQFALFHENFLPDVETQVSSVFNFRVQHADRRVGVSLPVQFLQNGVPFIVLEVACHFQLTPKSWNSALNIKTGRLKLPKAMAQHLAVLTVGTARGVLHAKLDRTPYSHFLLPALDVTAMIKGDITI